ncbi:hypothetical protein MY4038_005483 [Beauveria bassiana]
MAAAEDKVTPTDGEIRILLAIFAHMNGKPDVDWDAAAATASLRSAKSLKERYRQMCVRHGWTKKRRRGRYPGGGGGGGVGGVISGISSGAAGNGPSTPSKFASPSEVVKSTSGGQKRKQNDREGEELEEEEDDEVQQKQKPAVAAAGLDGEY